MINPRAYPRTAAALVFCVTASIVVITVFKLTRPPVPAPPYQPKQSKSCMPHFNRSRTPYEPCREENCFIFLDQKPYTVVPPNITHQLSTKGLFKCIEYDKTVPGLHGITFDILQTIAERVHLEDALCVFAGPECYVNDLVDFLEKEGGSYKFAIAGMLLEVPERRTTRLYPSTSFFDDQLVIVGNKDEASQMNRLTRPFRKEAWILFLAMLIVFTGFGALIVKVFSQDSFSVVNMALHFLGHVPDAGGGEPVLPPPEDPCDSMSSLPDYSFSQYQFDLAAGRVVAGGSASGSGPMPANTSADSFAGDISQSYQSSAGTDPNMSAQQILSQSASTFSHQEFQPETARSYRSIYYQPAVLLWRVALSMFLVILLLFYEVSVVNFLFLEQSSSDELVQVTNMGKTQLEDYAVLKNSAIERVWSETVDPYGSFRNPFLWRRCDTVEECFNLLGNDKVKYVVTFNALAKYHIFTNKMCKKWTIFSTQHIELYKFGAGWLFGKKIDPAFRRDVTKEILNLRVEDIMRELVEKTMNGKDQRCAALNGEIEAEIVALPLGLLVGPCLLILGLVLYMNRARRAENSSPAQLAASGNDFFNSFSGERGIQDSNSISWQRQLELIDAVVKKRR